MSFDLALITGATSGIGEALASLLAQNRVQLILTGRQSDKLETLASQLNAKEILVADLSQSEGRDKVIECIKRNVPDLVINNAGFGFYGDLLSLPIDDQLRIAQVNAIVPLELTLVAARSLIEKQRSGVILNVSSVAGEFPCPGMSVYGASKAFLTNLSLSLNYEARAHGVHILTACPGMVATNFSKRAAKKGATASKGGPVLSAAFAAQEIWKQILQKKEKHIFNWQYRLVSWVAKRFIPISLIENKIWTQIKKRS